MNSMSRHGQGEQCQAKVLGIRLLRIRRDCRTLDQRNQCSNLSGGPDSAAKPMRREKWAPQLKVPCDGYIALNSAPKLESIRSTAVEWHLAPQCQMPTPSVPRQSRQLGGISALLSAETPIMKTALTLHMGDWMIKGDQIISQTLLEPLVSPLPNMSSPHRVD
jgi:hypothetical protein